MATIISEANLITMPSSWWPNTANITLSSVKPEYNFDYQQMYRSHMNVRICVDFLARNVAHLGLHIYRRSENNDRERIRDHKAANILKFPMPTQ